MYLKAHQPDLGIDNPYELDDKQFNAAVDLLKQQKPNVGEYWSDAAKQISAFTNGDDQVGTTWQYQYFALKGDGQPVAAPGASRGIHPDGGLDRMVGHLDDLLPGEASELHVHVDEPHHRPQGQRPGGGVVRRGARHRARRVISRQTRISVPTTTPTIPTFWSKVYYWNTPVADCGDDRGDVCMDYNDWVNAWTEIKG